MGKDPVWTLLFRFSGPAILSMTIAASYNLVDAIFVGQLGAQALAAITVAFPITLVFQAICTGTGVGAGSIISRYLGSGDKESADRVASAAVTISFGLSGIIIIIFIPFLAPILTLFGAAESVLPLAGSYMRILIFFSAISFFPSIMSSVIRAEGSPMVASSALIISSLMNILLDPILIFGIGPIPGFGIEGAAAATIMARGIGALIVLRFFLTGQSIFRFRLSYFIPKLWIVLGIYRIGISSIIRSAATFVVMGVANRAAAAYGVIPLAAMGIFLRLFRFAVMPCLGIGQGLIPLVGFNYGAGQTNRVGEIILKAAICGSVWSGSIWLIIMIFPGQIISFFNHQPEFVHQASSAIRIYALFFLTLGIQLIPGFFFQAIGKGLPATILSSSRQILFLLPCLIILPKYFGVTGIWFSFPMADALGLILALAWGLKELGKQNINLPIFSSK